MIKLQAGHRNCGSISGRSWRSPILQSLQRGYEAQPTSLQWVSGDLSPKVNLPGRETGRSLPFVAKVRGFFNYKSALVWCVLGVNRDTIAFTVHVACNLTVAGNDENQESSDCELACDVKKKSSCRPFSLRD